MRERDATEGSERLTLDCLRGLADDYCNGEELQRVLLEQVLERFIALADEQLTARSETAAKEATCATCNDDPAVCATVPGLRHCELATREGLVDPLSASVEPPAHGDAVKAIETWLAYGEESLGKSQQGYFSGDGWAARILREHLTTLKWPKKCEPPAPRSATAHQGRDEIIEECAKACQRIADECDIRASADEGDTRSHFWGGGARQCQHTVRALKSATLDRRNDGT